MKTTLHIMIVIILILVSGVVNSLPLTFFLGAVAGSIGILLVNID